MSHELDPFVLVPDAPSEQGEEPTFVWSPEVAAVAHAHLGKQLALARLRADPDVRLGYALQVGVKPDQGRSREATIDTIAKAVKAPKLWAALGEYDGIIWVNEQAWQHLGQRQREAVVLHELLHFDVDDKGRLVVLKHDVEEFGLVASLYGPWHGGLERFGEQLRAFDAKPI